MKQGLEEEIVQLKAQLQEENQQKYTESEEVRKFKELMEKN